MSDRLNSPTTKEEVQRFIDDEIQESLHLDYKDSRALSKNKKDEIIKDVTSFANADGGMIIYGVKEEGHLPKDIDGGIDNTLIDREWIDQILSTNISPMIDGIQINQIPFSDSHSLFVINVPKSYQGPHQSIDKKYYKRYNFRSSPMDHYEIFDIANRKSRVPSLIKVDVEIIKYMVRLTVENISNYAASNVSFRFSDDFEWPRNQGFPRAFERGIRYFPPGKKFSYYYESSFSAFDETEDIVREFEIHVSYQHPELGRETGETFYINLDDYYGTFIDSDESEKLTKTLKDGFKMIKDSLNNIGRSMK
ncbi:MAG: ATP-binding protein [Saprospiraceae bacterium]|nr:ATP-binding protein [Saprospiraceae bacterium]